MPSFCRLVRDRAQAVLRNLCKLHKFPPQNCLNFVQHFILKPLDKFAPMWYNINVKRETSNTYKRRNYYVKAKTQSSPLYL